MLTQSNKYDNCKTNVCFLLSTLLLLGFAWALVGCRTSYDETVKKSEAEANLVFGLLFGQEQGKRSVENSLIAIRGLWKTGYYNAGTFDVLPGQPRLVVTTSPNGLGSWVTTSSGPSGEILYRIIEIDNKKRSLIYQQGKSDVNDFSSFPGGPDLREKYGRIVWTEPRSQGCEADGKRCFDYCEIEYGLSSIQAVKASSNVADSTNVKTGGCGGSAWSHAIQIEDFTSWGN